ncbi:uncharacterized protein LOC129601075 [Paramacrobiotus metropolitanus]|uniref:uncharacterized protein LOC129601075 n=1 Tax=Paramacrobiotus metropolitanus TaxID=2943436 RepID=UPI002445B263|nr:uncharacterized protein LOC129601075 [Paramacrobiotus metropolitanus]
MVEAIPGLVTATWVTIYSAIALAAWALTKRNSSNEDPTNCNSTPDLQSNSSAVPPGLFFYKIFAVFLGISSFLTVACLIHAIVVLADQVTTNSMAEMSGFLGLSTGTFFILSEPLFFFSAIYDIKHAGEPETSPTADMTLELTNRRTGELLHDANMAQNVAPPHYPQMPHISIILKPNIPSSTGPENLDSRIDWFNVRAHRVIIPSRLHRIIHLL